MIKCNTIVTALLGFLICVPSGFSQSSATHFVIDKSKPYVYLKFDHLGPREPLKYGESSKGIWLRLVNNCYLPIRIRVYGVGTPGGGIGVDFNVVRVPMHILSDNEPTGDLPSGYSTENGGTQTIAPSKDLMFNVPVGSVTKAWYIEVGFNFVLSEPGHGAYHPHSVADFRWDNIPQEDRTLLESGQ
jgi:hypothetical protein